MSLENKLGQIVVDAGMHRRPEYYSGRGAITSDLNSPILEKIYQGIEKQYGKKSANQYVKMVAKIPKLSATDFLLSLSKLESNNWKLKGLNLGRERGVYVDGPTDKAKFAVGLFTIAGVFSGGSERDETDFIKGQFLHNHNIKTGKKVISDYDNSVCY
jgi:hypothetical protein